MRKAHYNHSHETYIKFANDLAFNSSSQETIYDSESENNE